MLELVIIPLLIFFARILDVSIGTMRLIFVAKGMKYLAPLLGFVEVLIWLLAIGQILQNLTNWVNYIAYASGFAMGNYIGMIIEDRLALGMAIIRIITRKDATDLEDALREKEYGVTCLDATGSSGPVKVLFMVVDRKEQHKVIDVVKKYNPRSFYSIEDIRTAQEGIFPVKKKSNSLRGFSLKKMFRIRK